MWVLQNPDYGFGIRPALSSLHILGSCNVGSDNVGYYNAESYNVGP